MTLTLTFVLKIVFSDSVVAGGIVFYKHTLIFSLILYAFAIIKMFVKEVEFHHVACTTYTTDKPDL